MLEKLPDAIGHVLRDQRAGLDQLLFNRLPLRSGQGALQLSSLAFIDHGPLPALYTADGDGRSPPLQWQGVPSDAVSLVLVVEDADSPTPHPLVHAIAIDLPVALDHLPEGGLQPDAELPAPGPSSKASGTTVGLGDPTAQSRTDEPGAIGGALAAAAPVHLGRNSYLRTGWLPPDPPPGHGVHRYAFQLFALSATTGLSGSPGREAVADAVARHAIASGLLIATYERPDGSVRVGSAAGTAGPTLA
jgi:Raf kinase inhibitor-like YbhB/YbcL family protein